MKNYKIIFLGFLFMTLVMGCDTTSDNEVIVHPDGDVPIHINSSQAFSYSNNNGENLLANGTYKDEHLSLIATDENHNDLYIEGQLIADIENIAEIRSKGDNLIELFFGRDIDNGENSRIGYYKLKYDENKYDSIVVHFYYSLQNGRYHYITDIVYNGVEYVATDIIEIIKEE